MYEGVGTYAMLQRAGKYATRYLCYQVHMLCCRYAGMPGVLDAGMPDAATTCPGL